MNELLNELTDTDGVPLDELDELELVALPLPPADAELLELLELPHAATAQQAQIAATTRKSLLLSKLGTSSFLSFGTALIAILEPQPTVKAAA